MFIALGAWVLTLGLHVASWAGATFDGRELFWAALVGIIGICSPCFLLAGQGGPTPDTPRATLRSRIVNGAFLVLGLYVVVMGYTALPSGQRAEPTEQGRITIWHGERTITTGQARFLTAFPLPFFAIAGLVLWDRERRDRESLSL